MSDQNELNKDASIDSLIERAMSAACAHISGGGGHVADGSNYMATNGSDALDNHEQKARLFKLPKRPRIIVVGNTKGGTGKSTTAMHLIVTLMRDGYKVGAIDLDSGQSTLSRYFDSRRLTATRCGLSLPQPLFRRAPRNTFKSSADAEADNLERLIEMLAGLGHCDFVVIDTPGSNDVMSRIGHFCADTLVTPLNDSFVDLTLLANVDPETNEFIAVGSYTNMVCQQMKARAQCGGGPVDWVVTRNRLSTLGSRNRRNMDTALATLAQRIGFRLAPGFCERVVFRELYMLGLTLLDIRDDRSGVELNMSHIAALQEVRSLMQTLGFAGNEAIHQIWTR